MTIIAGALYVVATPIGNLGDMSPRAVETLRTVGLIAAEDTRHSMPLLRHFGISTPCIAYHEHNEREVSERLVQRLKVGEAVALISDAGTPMLSDPGYHLIRAARAAGLRVIPIPGPSALTAALSVAGLPADRFVFEGFLPAKTAARRAQLETLKGETRTLVFYEAPHRIVDTLQDMTAVFGEMREVVLARELTKTFETVHGAMLRDLCDWVQIDANRQRGEFVVLLRGVQIQAGDAVALEVERVLRILAAELPLKQSCALAAAITGEKRNRLYAYALGLGLKD